MTTTPTPAHERKLISVAKRGRELTVDIHCHMHIAAADALVPDRPPPFPFITPESATIMGQMLCRVAPKLNGTKERLADMDAQGVDVQAISPSPGQYFYFAPPEVGRDAARTINNGIAEAVASEPSRFVGMGTVPLQDTELAVAEMRRCVKELDLRGIEISTNVNGMELTDPRFRPFFAAAEELGVLLFMHPLGVTEGRRLTDHYLSNIIGNPLESTIALSHMIFGGMLDRHPGLRLCVAHGGGFLPAYWGRMDHAYHAREDCCAHISRPPSTYLRQIWLDTLVFDREQLASLVRSHGVDKLCMGTDYPFDMGEADPVGFHSELDAGDRARILGLNAADLLGLTVD